MHSILLKWNETKQNCVIYFMWKMPFVCFNAFQFIFQSFCLSFNLLHFFMRNWHFFLNPNITTSWSGKNWQKVKWLQYVSCCICVYFFLLFHSEVKMVDAVFFHCYVCVCMLVCPRKILAFNVCKMCRLLLLLLSLFFVVLCEWSWNCSTWLERLILICNSWCNCFIDAAHHLLFDVFFML